MAKMERPCNICGSDVEHAPKECIGKMVQDGVRAELRRIVDLLRKEFPVRLAVMMPLLKKIVGD